MIPIQDVPDELAIRTRLMKLQEAWNDGEAVVPNPSAITKAVEWSVAQAREIHASGLPWLTPHTTVSVSGDVVLEWWRGERKLTVFISEAGAEYLQSWGTDIASEMAEGSADSTESRLAVWRWLTQ